jgi:hypothetical protein
MTKQEKWKHNLIIYHLNELEECAEIFNNVLFPLKGFKYKKINYGKKV